MDYNQSVDVTIHRLAREALQKRRTTAKGVELELQKELEALSEEVKELLGQLPVDKGAALKTYLEKMRLLSEKEGDYLYFQDFKYPAIRLSTLREWERYLAAGILGRG